MPLEIFEEAALSQDVHFSGKLDKQMHPFVIKIKAPNHKAHYSEEDSSVGYNRLHVFEDHKQVITTPAEKLIHKHQA